MLSFSDVEQARARIKEQIYLSPFPSSETISRMTGNRVFFKLENLQLTGSFKERGALNRLLLLTPEEAKRGTIRKKFAHSKGENSVHGSDSTKSASREIKMNFIAKEIVG